MVALYVREGKVSRYFGVFWGQKPLNWGHVFCIMIKIQLLYGRCIIWGFIMLRPYEAFLTEKGNVRSQYIPFYLKWVSDCYAFLNEPLSNRLTSEQSNQFLSHMAKRHEDWQVEQYKG